MLYSNNIRVRDRSDPFKSILMLWTPWPLVALSRVSTTQPVSTTMHRLRHLQSLGRKGRLYYTKTKLLGTLVKYILFVNGELFSYGTCQRSGQGTVMAWSEEDNTLYRMNSSVCETNYFLLYPTMICERANVDNKRE